MTDQLLEAVEPAAFLERVQGLHKGEVAQLKGGVAVKHVALEDGRAAYRVGSPSAWGSGATEFYGDTHRTADRAVRAAFARSAGSTDPESIGGETSLSTYGTVLHGGRQVRVRGFTETGRARVEHVDGSGGTAIVNPAALAPRAPLTLASDRSVAEAAEVGKPGTNWTQVTPEHRSRIEPIVRHYMGRARPFTECVRDNRKRFGPAAERVCAVVKDMGMRTTRWRAGGKKVKEAEVAAFTGRLLEAAGGDADAVEEMLLAGIIGPLAEDFDPTQPRDEAGKWVKVVSGLKPNGMVRLPMGTLVRRNSKGTTFLVGTQRGHMGFVSPRHGTAGFPDPLRAAHAAAQSERRGRRIAGLESLPRTRESILAETITLRSNTARRGDADYGVRPASVGPDQGNPDFNRKHPRASRGTATGGKFIRKGDSGGEVRGAQRRLGVAVTGVVDPNTVASIRSFQKLHGLQVDGVIGRQTALALSGQIARAQAATPGAMGDYTRKLASRGFRRKAAARRAPAERVGGGLLVR